MNENISFTNDFQSICALIIHLGTHEKWQSRTAREIAGSLAMEKEKVERILLDYPCFFRESENKKEGQRLFTVHLRYTRRKKDPTTGQHIAEPLTAEEVGILINILMQMVSIEKQESQFFTEVTKTTGGALKFLSPLQATGHYGIFPTDRTTALQFGRPKGRGIKPSRD